MASIDNPQLAITPYPMQNRASVSATCNVELTRYEVNAMRLLGLTYVLECRVLNRDLQYEDTVLTYEPQSVPGVLLTVHMVFEMDAVMSDLHEHIFTRDKLIAEFTLTNSETGAQEIVRSDVITADLTA
jgi:hypothetical protein